MRRRGVTIVELLVVVAIVGLLSALAFAWAPSGFAFARAYAAGVAAARARAAVSGVSVAVGGAPCGVAADAVRIDPAPATVLTFPARGLVFMADGTPRSCDGGGVGNATILLAHRNRRAAVIVSALGRVRWEPR